MNHRLLLFLLFIPCCVLIAPETQAVDIAFSDPIIVDSTVGEYYPWGTIIDQDQSNQIFDICSGPTYDLAIIGVRQHKGVLIARRDSDGNIIDSIPIFTKNINAATHAFAHAIWIDPYYYIFTTSDVNFYYTRIDEQLNVLASLPVQYILHGWDPAFDGEYVWTMNNKLFDTAHFNLYHLPDMTPELQDIEIYMDRYFQSYFMGNNGLYICSCIGYDSAFIPIYVSTDGAVHEYAPVDVISEDGTNYRSTFQLLSVSDSCAYFSWIERTNDGVHALKYFVIPDDSSKFTGEIRSHRLDQYPEDRALVPKRIVPHEGKITFFCTYDELIEAITLDPANDTITLIRSIPETELLARSGTMGEIYRDGIFQFLFSDFNYEDKILMQKINASDSQQIFSPSHAFYRSKAQREPTILFDDSQLLLYYHEADTSNEQVFGENHPNSGFPQLGMKQQILPTDSLNLSPHLYNLGDDKALYWIGKHNNGYYGMFLFFSGSFPTPEELADSIILKKPNRRDPPAIERIDSLLYVAQYYYWTHEMYALELRSVIHEIDIKHREKINEIYHPFTSGRFPLIKKADTVLSCALIVHCVDDGLTSCREYDCGIRGDVIWHDSVTHREGRSYFGGPYIACGFMMDDQGDTYNDFRMAKIDGRYILTLDDYAGIYQVNDAFTGLQTVVDLETETDIPFPDGPEPFDIYPVEIPDGAAIFLINNLHIDQSYVLIFDRDWIYLDYAPIPLLGSPAEFSNFEYSPDLDEIYFAYSAFLSKPYTSTRIILQSISVDQITDVNDDATKPEVFQVRQNSPNPFNASTKISYYIPSQSDITIVIYNILGQEVQKVSFENKSAGWYEFIWNGADSRGKTVASGIYIYSIKTNRDAATRKMILLK